MNRFVFLLQFDFVEGNHSLLTGMCFLFYLLTYVLASSSVRYPGRPHRFGSAFFIDPRDEALCDPISWALVQLESGISLFSLMVVLFSKWIAICFSCCCCCCLSLIGLLLSFRFGSGLVLGTVIRDGYDVSLYFF